MTAFLEQERGKWLIQPTDTALRFAGDDHDLLVAATFLGLLRHHKVSFEWLPGEPRRIDVGRNIILACADRGLDPETILLSEYGSWYTHVLAGRVMSGATPVVLLIGLTSQLAQSRRHRQSDAVQLFDFLSISDWLKQFPHLHTPYAEAAA